MVRFIRLLAPAALALAVVAVMPAVSEEPPADAERLGSARETLAKWVETQQIISKEKKDWQVGKEMLEQRISLLKGEVAALGDKSAETRENITEADRNRMELISENNALKAGTSTLQRVIGPMETKVRSLLKSLPDPVRERVAPLAHRIPENSASTDLSLSERYQNVIGILNEVNKFNRDVTVTSEVRTLPGGTTAEVKALYLGLGQAYYVTASGDGAGFGRPTPDGWEWTPANELAPKIARVIAILQNQDVPAYVPLPVEIR
jgi:hypothetical protein